MSVLLIRYKCSAPHSTDTDTHASFGQISCYCFLPVLDIRFSVIFAGSSLCLLLNPVFTAWCSYASMVLGVVILSIRLSITRILCDKTKQCTIDILIPHERAIALVFWHQQWLVAMPLPSEIYAERDLPPPPSKNADFDRNQLQRAHHNIVLHLAS